MSDALKDALALAPSFIAGLIGFVLSFGLSGELWVNLAAAVLAFALSLAYFLRDSGRRWPMVIGGSACLLAAVLAPSALDGMHSRPAPAPPELVREIAAATIPIESVDAGSGFADLEPLRHVWQGTRVVALGEASHGTSEFFRMKHRLIEFLVMQMGFRHVALELDEGTAGWVDRYIHGKSGNDPIPSADWPWATREMDDLVGWLRQHNAGVPEAERVHVYGIDFQGERRDFRMARNTLDLVERLGIDARVVVWAHNSHISSGPGWMGSYLKPALENQIYLTGFEFGQGSFTSRMNWTRTYRAETADTRFYAGTLAAVGKPVLFLDFRTMLVRPAVGAWLEQSKLSHSLQEGHGVLRLVPSWVRNDESWPSLYDGVIYIERSTPAKTM